MRVLAVGNEYRQILMVKWGLLRPGRGMLHRHMLMKVFFPDCRATAFAKKNKQSADIGVSQQKRLRRVCPPVVSFCTAMGTGHVRCVGIFKVPVLQKLFKAFKRRFCLHKGLVRWLAAYMAADLWLDLFPKWRQ